MKVLQLLLTVFAVLFVAVGPAMAADVDHANGAFSGPSVGAGIGAAVTIIGAGWGFGRIGAAALESMARQPEAAGRIQTGMIIIAALLEGATFFALIVCIQVAGGVKP